MRDLLLALQELGGGVLAALEVLGCFWFGHFRAVLASAPRESRRRELDCSIPAVPAAAGGGRRQRIDEMAALRWSRRLIGRRKQALWELGRAKLVS